MAEAPPRPESLRRHRLPNPEPPTRLPDSDLNGSLQASWQRSGGGAARPPGSQTLGWGRLVSPGPGSRTEAQSAGAGVARSQPEPAAEWSSHAHHPALAHRVRSAPGAGD